MKTEIQDKAVTFLRKSVIPPDIASEIVKDITDNIDPSKSKHCPLILKVYKKLRIALKQFEMLPMHCCCLGVETSLI